MPTQTGVRGIRKPMAVTYRNRHAQAEIVEALQAHAGLIIQSAARVLGSAVEAEDVAQDLAEKLLRSPPGEVRSWPALLKTMAVNASIDRVRRRRAQGEMPELATHVDPSVELDREQKAGALRGAVARLSERDATLFSLYYLADLPQADIARQLDMTPTAVGVALHRARQRLGDLLNPSLNSDDAGAS